jgi:putative OPT family oligopeptide transporter
MAETTQARSEVSNASDERIYTPAPGELQLTARALVAGCLIGSLIATINLFFGLKTGWNVGGGILAAILSYAAFAALKPVRPFTVLETNIAQTAASSTGLMTMTAGLVAPIPALRMLGRELGWLELTVWAASVAWIGVFFAVPLRRQMVLVERLRFPSGTATAHTILAMHGSGAETMRRARTLLRWAAVATVVALAMWAIEPLKQPPLAHWLGSGFATAATYTFSLYLDPMLIGAGILVGLRTSLSLAAGAIVAWGILAPLATSQGWVENTAHPLDAAKGARGWILWTGVAIMLADALTSLALSWRTIVAVFRPKRGGTAAIEDPAQAIPAPWWLGGLACSTVAACLALAFVFGIPWWMTLIAILLSWVLAAIAVRSSGETDINPVTGVAKVSQLVFGGVAPGQLHTNLMAGAVAGAGASQAADMMGDLKTGHLLGASPRKQFLAQLVGIAAGVVFCVPIYLLVTQGGVGTKDLPAPSASAWKATAELVAVGVSALPKHALWGVVAGLVFGAAVPLLRRFAPRTAPYLPSAMAFGIAFIIFAYMAVPFLIGALVHLVWRRRAPAQAADLAFPVASGILLGAGLASIVTAIFGALKLQPWVPMPH